MGAAGAAGEKVVAPQAPLEKKWWRRRRHKYKLVEKQVECSAAGAAGQQLNSEGQRKTTHSTELHSTQFR